MNNIDIILNFSSPVTFIDDNNKKTIIKGFHFSGIRNRHSLVRQEASQDVIGISFYPGGLYPFLGIPLSEFSNRVIEMDSIFQHFTSDTGSRLYQPRTVSEKIAILEELLSQYLNRKLVPRKEVFQMINILYSKNENYNIKNFCERGGIHPRTLERLFNRYVGTSPKHFLRLNRFQGTLNRIVRRDFPNLTSVAYENEFYDQGHFIKDFKSYTGSSPSRFLDERNSIREIMDFI